MILAGDTDSTRAVAQMPRPSVRIFRLRSIRPTGAIGVPLQSLNQR